MKSWKRTVHFCCHVSFAAVLGTPRAMALSRLEVLRDQRQVVRAGELVRRGYESEVWAHVPRVVTGSSAIVWWYTQFIRSEVPGGELLRPRRPEVLDVITRSGSWSGGTQQFTVQVSDDMHVDLNLLPYHPSGRHQLVYARSESTVGCLGGVWVMSLESMQELLESRVRELNQLHLSSDDYYDSNDLIEDDKNRSLAIRKAEHDIAVLQRMARVYRWLMESPNSATPRSAHRMGQFWAEKRPLHRFFARHRGSD